MILMKTIFKNILKSNVSVSERSAKLSYFIFSKWATHATKPWWVKKTQKYKIDWGFELTECKKYSDSVLDSTLQ